VRPSRDPPTDTFDPSAVLENIIRCDPCLCLSLATRVYQTGKTRASKSERIFAKTQEAESNFDYIHEVESNSSDSGDGFGVQGNIMTLNSFRKSARFGDVRING
jgi:hypothetical protein